MMNAILVFAVLASAYLVIGAAGPKAPKRPDLVISAISAPSVFPNGVPTVVNVTTKNQGTGTAGASTTQLHTLLFGAQNAAVPSLAAGATYVTSHTITCSIGGNNSSSSFTLYGNADVFNVVSESNEANNQLTRAATCI